MFRAVNMESERQRREARAENQRINELYLAALKSRDYGAYLALDVQYDQNKPLYARGKSNLMYNYVCDNSVDTLRRNAWGYNLTEYKHSLFRLAKKNIDAGNFVYAKKLLNAARAKGWGCNSLYDLEARIEKEYFSGMATLPHAPTWDRSV
ncbi:hypothetical protein PAPHI01_0154 [Pancytospora philotis]|nr:hypothetical protein PAPHI01_0154 [Pancytospora philotis]